MPITKKVKGDLIKMAEKGEFDVIAHGCNCQHVMGTGIALQLKNKWPKVYEEDGELIERFGSRCALGKIRLVNNVLDNLVVVNMYTQYDYRRAESHADRAVSYDAVADAFSMLNTAYKNTWFRIGIPLIGSGLGGGNQVIIEAIVNEMTPDLDITLVEYCG